MIPPLLHYCWVGPKPMPDLAQRCLRSWQACLPGFTIRRWDERNSPMEHPFMRQMYASGRYGFVPDYLRFWALETFGGIYVDCDVEILRPLDPLRSDRAFLGFMCTQNRLRKNAPATALLGAVPGHPFFREIRQVYDRLTIPRMSNSVVEDVMNRWGFQRWNLARTEFDSIRLGDVRIYHADLLHPVEQGPGGRQTPRAVSRSLAVHHGTFLWGGDAEPPGWWQRWKDARWDRKILRPLEQALKRRSGSRR